MRANELGLMKMAGLGVLLGGALALGGCKSNSAAPIVDMNSGPDPAAANMASGSTAPASQGQVLGQQAYAPPATASGEQYPETGYDPNQYADPAYDESQVDQGAQALYAPDAPPPLPDYQQPELTEAGYMWTPGYWAYGPAGYYWVPGAWVAPPYAGALWTPAYWGNCGIRYCFHGGYWGLHIGFYGGISYGFGYYGHGYEGGYWNGGNFYYNQRVNRVNVNDVRNVYTRNVNEVNNRTSFNGPNGVNARPLPAEMAVLHERRTPPMQVQVAQIHSAATNRQQSFAENKGRPAVAVAQQHFAADRTPPVAIEPRPVGNPAENQRPPQPQGRPVQPPHPGEAQRVAPRAEPQRMAPRPGVEPQRVAPQPQRTAPHPEPQRVAPQPEPQRMAPPQRVAPRPEPQRVAPPQPAPQRAAPRPMPERAPTPPPQRAAAPPQRAQPEMRPAPSAPHPAAAPHPPPAPRPAPPPRAERPPPAS